MPVARPLASREYPHERRDDRVRLEQQVKREDQDRDDAEDAADEAPHRADDGTDGVGAASRRLRHGLANAQLTAEQPAIDQPRLRPVEHVRKRRPERTRLVDERRDHQQTDTDDDADEAYVDDEDGGPSRHRL